MANEFLDLLHEEHEKVKNTLEQLKMGGKASSQKQQLFNSLWSDLTPHLRGEERFFYSALQEKTGAKKDALEAVEEHHAAKLILNELDETPMQEERWGAKLSVFKEMIDHHVEEEEVKIFPDAEKYLTKTELKNIMKEYQSSKELLRVSVGEGLEE